MNVLNMFEINRAATARRRDADLAALREEVAAGQRIVEDAERAVAQARAAEAAATARARDAERALPAGPGPSEVGPSGPEEPPAVARELITMADRLVDLTTGGAPVDPEQANAALRWLTGRMGALLAMCEVAPITDDGVLDFMRHEVVADRPTPNVALVDHIADTVRPGYRWRHDLLRPQQVVAYVAAGRNPSEEERDHDRVR